MSFDTNPTDDDPHGECRHEIQSLQSALAAMTAERDEARRELLGTKAGHNLICDKIGTIQEKVKADLVLLESKITALLDERNTLHQSLAALERALGEGA